MNELRAPVRLEVVMRQTTDRFVKRFRSRPEQSAVLRGFSFGPMRFGPQPFLARRPEVKSYARLGDLEVRLATTRSEVRKAQRLRYQVFYREMCAVPSSKLAMMARRDEDGFDAICDHLLVLDHSPIFNGRRRWTKRPRIVGTYRLLRGEVAERHQGFYSQGEYDVEPLLGAACGDLRFMELGRSCVLRSHRNKRTIELLWQGIWNYAREHEIDVMIGCASFEGVDPDSHAEALSYLHHTALAPEGWRVRAHERLHVDMNMMPIDRIDSRSALKALPPLIKGYLRVGAFVGDGAVIDRQFGTTDVFVILPVEAIRSRYFAHFGQPNAVRRGPVDVRSLN